MIRSMSIGANKSNITQTNVLSSKKFPVKNILSYRECYKRFQLKQELVLVVLRNYFSLASASFIL